MVQMWLLILTARVCVQRIVSAKYDAMQSLYITCIAGRHAVFLLPWKWGQQHVLKYVGKLWVCVVLQSSNKTLFVAVAAVAVCHFTGLSFILGIFSYPYCLCRVWNFLFLKWAAYIITIFLWRVYCVHWWCSLKITICIFQSCGVFHCFWTSAHTSNVLTGCSSFLFRGKQLVLLSLFASWRLWRCHWDPSKNLDLLS
jgi:hypothetical protein